jgi:hypothetical protein
MFSVATQELSRRAQRVNRGRQIGLFWRTVWELCGPHRLCRINAAGNHQPILAHTQEEIANFFIGCLLSTPTALIRDLLAERLLNFHAGHHLNAPPSIISHRVRACVCSLADLVIDFDALVSGLQMSKAKRASVQ